MRIDINQKKVAIGDKYTVFVDGRQEFAASTELFRFLAVINLVPAERPGTRLMTIRKRWAWLRIRYSIARYDNRNLEFRGDSFWKAHYTCRDGPCLYDIYGHRGRKYSVYKDNIQVAWWEKEAVTWFEGDNYSILADNDCDVELIIGFCLIIDNYSSNDNDGSTVTIDLGNIGPQVKEFNPHWKPK